MMDKILVIILNAMGDVIRATPVFSQLRKQYPTAYIAAVSESLGCAALANHPDIDDLFLFDADGIKNNAFAAQNENSPTAALWELMDHIAHIGFDCVINLQFSEISALMTHAAHAPTVYGRTVDDAGNTVIAGETMTAFYHYLRNRDGKRFETKKHLATWFQDVLADCGINVTYESPRMYFTAEDSSFAESFLSEHGYHNDALLIGMHIGAGHFYEEKGWPLERFRDLAGWLSREYTAQILLVGSSHEAEQLIPRIHDSLPSSTIVAAGKTTVAQTAALLAACTLVISNDSGPMHIAAAVGTPTIGLFGGSFPHESQPNGTEHSAITGSTIRDISLEDVQKACTIKLSSLTENR